MESKDPAPICWALLGCSRGLGGAFIDLLVRQRPQDSACCWARHWSSADDESQPYTQPGWHFLQADFANVVDQARVLSELSRLPVDRLIYFAGGGPFGLYEKKAWKDHHWALQVSLVFPSRLLHHTLAEKGVRQCVFIGSSIAEAAPDPLASSYAAAKHGLRGLITSVQEENLQRPEAVDVRLFSPGYMNTKLLPLNAKLRLSDAGALWEPQVVASRLLEFCLSPAGRNSVLSPRGPGDLSKC